MRRISAMSLYAPAGSTCMYVCMYVFRSYRAIVSIHPQVKINWVDLANEMANFLLCTSSFVNNIFKCKKKMCFWSGCTSAQLEMCTCVNGNVFIVPLQLQSNLIPGLNLNALGLFPSGAPGMGPNMSSGPPPGAHGGCPSFGVSVCRHGFRQTLAVQTGCVFNLHLAVFQLLVQDGETEANIKSQRLGSMCPFISSFSSVPMGVRGNFGPLCHRRAASHLP